MCAETLTPFKIPPDIKRLTKIDSAKQNISSKMD